MVGYLILAKLVKFRLGSGRGKTAHDILHFAPLQAYARISF